MKNVKYICGNLFLALGVTHVVVVEPEEHGVVRVWDVVGKKLNSFFTHRLTPVLTKTGKQARAIRLVPKHLRPKEEAPVVNVQAQLDKFSKAIAGKTGVSSWLSVEDGKFKSYVDRICHAAIAPNSVVISRHWEPIVHKWDMMTIERQKNYRVWFDYVTKESPWKHAFLTNDFEQALKNHVEMDVSVTCFQVMGAITALRMGHEFPDIVRNFVFFINEGYSKPDAFVLASFLNDKYTVFSLNEGHTVFKSTHGLDELFRFIHHGYSKEPLKDTNAKAFSKQRRVPGGYFGIQDNIAKDGAGGSRNVPFLSEDKEGGWYAKVVFDAERMKQYIENKEYDV